MPTPYRRLQSRAKQAGIPANQSARELERQLAATTPRFATSTPQPNLDDPDDDEVPPPTTSDDAGGRHGWAALRTRAAIDFRGFSGDEAYDADDADAPADPLNMSDMAREAVKQFRKGGQIAMLRRKQTRYCCNHVVPAASETPLTERWNACVQAPVVGFFGDAVSWLTKFWAFKLVFQTACILAWASFGAVFGYYTLAEDVLCLKGNIKLAYCATVTGALGAFLGAMFAENTTYHADLVRAAAAEFVMSPWFKGTAFWILVLRCEEACAIETEDGSFVGWTCSTGKIYPEVQLWLLDTTRGWSGGRFGLGLPNVMLKIEPHEILRELVVVGLLGAYLWESYEEHRKRMDWKRHPITEAIKRTNFSVNFLVDGKLHMRTLRDELTSNLLEEAEIALLEEAAKECTEEATQPFLRLKDVQTARRIRRHFKNAISSLFYTGHVVEALGGAGKAEPFVFGVTYETKDSGYAHRKIRVLIIRKSELESPAFGWTARPPRWTASNPYFLDRFVNLKMLRRHYDATKRGLWNGETDQDMMYFVDALDIAVSP